MNPEQPNAVAWRPSAGLEMLKIRAEVNALIRDFFQQRQVLEVDTPILGLASATDPHLASISAFMSRSPGQSGERFYLHTSPEFPMKRLLAAGSGAIYQLCKCFRDAETGRRHNPEFTMLEWYRPGFSLEALMNEVAELVKQLLAGFSLPVRVVSYRQVFDIYLGIDPFIVSDSELRVLAETKTGWKQDAQAKAALARDDYLNLLLSSCIEPHLGKDEHGQPELCFLIAYPASQASLARVKNDEYGQSVAERFELYIQGLEIANGYDELTDAQEQRQRFESDNQLRRQLGLPEVAIDKRLIAALTAGLPACSGVALGLDRLLMVRQQATSIDEIISFPLSLL